MPKSDPVDILLAHNRWANDNLIAACAPLTGEQFRQRFDMGVGSLEKTIVHILGAMRGWTDMLTGAEQRPRLETQDCIRESLADLHNQVADDFETAVRAHPLDGIATGSRGGKTYSFTRGGILTHVTTHGMHHRAQCLNMLRQLGIESLPPSAVVEWMFMADEPATAP